jgi:hypothetical protein
MLEWSNQALIRNAISGHAFRVLVDRPRDRSPVGRSRGRLRGRVEPHGRNDYPRDVPHSAER